jgi:hypothetical protein
MRSVVSSNGSSAAARNEASAAWEALELSFHPAEPNQDAGATRTGRDFRYELLEQGAGTLDEARVEVALCGFDAASQPGLGGRLRCQPPCMLE